jgi:hypothetical protein
MAGYVRSRNNRCYGSRLTTLVVVMAKKGAPKASMLPSIKCASLLLV